MKAIVITSPNNINLEEVPDPVIGDYDVKCKILASAICAGTDRHLIENDPYFKVKYPTIIGHEGIGRVVEIGPKVKNYKIGDLVTRIFNAQPKDSKYNLNWGAMAEYGTASDWQAMQTDGLDKSDWQDFTRNRVLPENFDPVEATIIITWRETLSYYKRMEPQTNDTVLILGSGANALAFANHSKNLGQNAIVIGSKKRKKQFLKMNPTIYLDYKNQTEIDTYLKDYINKINIIIDSIGDSKNLNSYLKFLNLNAKIGAYGLDGYLNYFINVSKIPGNFSYYSGEIYDEGSTHDEVIKLFEQGKLNAWDYLNKKHIYKLADFEKAYQANNHKECLKCVIRFDTI